MNAQGKVPRYLTKVTKIWRTLWVNLQTSTNRRDAIDVSLAACGDGVHVPGNYPVAPVGYRRGVSSTHGPALLFPLSRHPPLAFPSPSTLLTHGLRLARLLSCAGSIPHLRVYDPSMEEGTCTEQREHYRPRRSVNSAHAAKNAGRSFL